jgi:hypothetical protein
VVFVRFVVKFPKKKGNIAEGVTMFPKLRNRFNALFLALPATGATAAPRVAPPGFAYQPHRDGG